MDFCDAVKLTIHLPSPADTCFPEWPRFLCRNGKNLFLQRKPWRKGPYFPLCPSLFSWEVNSVTERTQMLKKNK